MSLTSAIFKMIQSKLNNNIKVVILIVSAWIFVSILTSFDTKNQTRSPPPMYYYTSLKNDFIDNRRKLAKTEVDTRLIEDIEQTENSDTDIFYDVSHELDEEKNPSSDKEFTREVSPEPFTNPEYKFETAKKILYFTSYFGMHDWMFGFGHQPFIDNNCPVTNCYITNKRDNMSINQFDAVMFHIRDMNDGHIALPNRKKRKSNQRYVMFLMESPKNDGFPYERFNNFFNWTMTFRLDSDFPNPYGWVEPIHSSFIGPPGIGNFPNLNYNVLKDRNKEEVKLLETLKEKTSKKQKLVAWMVSNCATHSQREYFVIELKKHIPVDIYGGCGKLKCKREDGDKCMQHINDNYKFYLSFENSVCNDYVTEKFWNPLSLDSVIPVVLGAGNYSRVAPTNSFIDAQSFESPAKLAEHLLYLDKNFDEYSKHFLWKTKFQVKSNNHNLAICKVCQELNNPKARIKSYSNMKEWWRGGGDCRSKGDFPWSPQNSPFSFTGLLEDARKTIFDGAGEVFEKLRQSKVIV